MPATYEPIASTTLSTSAESVTFSSIPQTYTDLILVMKAVDLSGVDGRGDIQVGNGSVDTGSNYSRTGLSGNGSSAASYRGSDETFWVVDSVSSSNGAAQSILHIFNYSNTTTNKTAIVRSDSVNLHTRAIVFLWRSTAAIDIITITSGTGGSTYQSGSTFTLYGIKAA